jgi:hypothetical protein
VVDDLTALWCVYRLRTGGEEQDIDLSKAREMRG